MGLRRQEEERGAWSFYDSIGSNYGHVGWQYFLRVSLQRGGTRKRPRNEYCGTVCRLSLL